jgi:dienelactone hydrolase
LEWPARREAIRKNIQWLLGDGPAYEPIKPDFSKGESDEEARRLLRPKNDHVRITFGDRISGNLYHPTTSGGEKSPGIIFLAPLQTCTGYVPGYREGEIPYPKWLKQGYAVLAFDPIATGGRQEERRAFYDRNPHWSLMGKMTLDARHAIDALAADPTVDPKRIYLAGFGMGGMAATFTAALDDRIAGTAVIAGFTPFRTDTDASATGGIRRWVDLYGWLPRLEPFIGHEEQIPVDFDEVLAAAAPHPMRVIAPKFDWHANNADVDRAAETARAVYRQLSAGDALVVDHPDRPCQFDDEMQALVGWK